MFVNIFLRVFFDRFISSVLDFGILLRIILRNVRSRVLFEEEK